MKLQFASIEAIMALLLATSAVSFAGFSINSLNHDAYRARLGVAASAAAYDFMYQLQGNLSERECLYLQGAGNSSCLPGFVQYYPNAYGFRSFSVSGNSSGIPKGMIAKCFPFSAPYGKREICIEVD